jgi:hypothetical protein
VLVPTSPAIADDATKEMVNMRHEYNRISIEVKLVTSTESSQGGNREEMKKIRRNTAE